MSQSVSKYRNTHKQFRVKTKKNVYCSCKTKQQNNLEILITSRFHSGEQQHVSYISGIC